jgi:hypothetical protein
MLAGNDGSTRSLTTSSAAAFRSAGDGGGGAGGGGTGGGGPGGNGPLQKNGNASMTSPAPHGSPLAHFIASHADMGRVPPPLPTVGTTWPQKHATAYSTPATV